MQKSRHKVFKNPAFLAPPWSIMSSDHELDEMPTSPRDPPTLLSLPIEIQEQILDHIFATFEWRTAIDRFGTAYQRHALKHATPMYPVGTNTNIVDWRQLLRGVDRAPAQASLLKGSKPSLTAGTMSILATCRRLHDLGIAVFYGMYSFRIKHAETFRLNFAKHLRPQKLQAIRTLQIDLPFPLLRHTKTFLPLYLRMFTEEMPYLTFLRIDTPVKRRNASGSKFFPAAGTHTALLGLASFITLRHPLLKYAVWKEDHTYAHDGVLAFECNRVNLSVHLSSKRPYLRWYDDPAARIESNTKLQKSRSVVQSKCKRYEIVMELYNRRLDTYNDFLSRQTFHMLSPYQPETADEYWDAGGQPKFHFPPTHPPGLFLTFDEQNLLETEPETIPDPRHLLLDSWKIRRTRYTVESPIEEYRPYRFQLPVTARDSESMTPSQALMSFEELCEENLAHLIPGRAKLKALARISNLEPEKRSKMLKEAKKQRDRAAKLENDFFVRELPTSSWEAHG